MLRKELLEKAAEITEGARQKHYGTPEDNFKNIAEFWQLYLSQRFENADESEISPTDVAIMMLLMKVARLVHDPHHDDSWLDIAGYAACGSQCAGASSDE